MRRPVPLAQQTAVYKTTVVFDWRLLLCIPPVPVQTAVVLYSVTVRAIGVESEVELQQELRGYIDAGR